VHKRAAAILPFAVFWGGQALAQTAPPLSNDDVSKEAENPVSRQITAPLRFQADFLDGVDHLTESTFEVDQRSCRSGSMTTGC
jgi:hypothetical protein